MEGLEYKSTSVAELSKKVYDAGNVEVSGLIKSLFEHGKCNFSFLLEDEGDVALVSGHYIKELLDSSPRQHWLHDKSAYERAVQSLGSAYYAGNRVTVRGFHFRKLGITAQEISVENEEPIMLIKLFSAEEYQKLMYEQTRELLGIKRY